MMQSFVISAEKRCHDCLIDKHRFVSRPPICRAKKLPVFQNKNIHEFHLRDRGKQFVEVDLFNKSKSQRRLARLLSPLLKYSAHYSSCHCLRLVLQRIRFEPMKGGSNSYALALVTDQGKVYARKSILRSRILSGKPIKAIFQQAQYFFPLLGKANGSGEITFQYERQKQQLLVTLLQGKAKISVSVPGLESDETDSAELTGLIANLGTTSKHPTKKHP